MDSKLKNDIVCEILSFCHDAEMYHDQIKGYFTGEAPYSTQANIVTDQIEGLFQAERLTETEQQEVFDEIKVRLNITRVREFQWRVLVL